MKFKVILSGTAIALTFLLSSCTQADIQAMVCDGTSMTDSKTKFTATNGLK